MPDREPPKQLVRDLLRQNWDNSNTFSITPNVKYGWFDTYDDPAYVIVRQPDENPLGGGETNFSYMTSGGPGREVDGTIAVHAFASNVALRDNGTATTNYGSEFLWGADASNDGTLNDHGAVKEIERIIGNNEVRPANPITGNTPVRFLSIGSSTLVDESGEAGGEFHHSIDIGYIYSSD